MSVMDAMTVLKPAGAARAWRSPAEAVADRPDPRGDGAALREKGVAEKQIKMRVSQLWNWIYVRGVSDFDHMANISKDMRETLKQHFTIGRPEIVDEQVSNDGTRKWLMRFPARGAGRPVEIETVYIPEEGRGTLCISSQVGCTLTCSFCHTGTQRWCAI
jgi:23S rRNA (adenine2503-C2)-methyltransferase